MKTIVVDIKGRSATVKTSGFTGKACYEATKDLERAMGKVVSDERTPEYNQTVTIPAQN